MGKNNINKSRKFFKNKPRTRDKFNEGICKCGHHSKDHSYNQTTYNDYLECDKCNCQNYEFSHLAPRRRRIKR